RKLLAALLWGAGVFLLLGQLLFPLTRTEEKAEAAGVEWLATLPEGFERAKASGRPVLVDAWATWCKACMDLKEKTLSDPTVIEVLRGFECVSPDMDAEANEAVWETYGIKGLPWVAVFRPDGTLVEESLLTDFEAAEPFRARLLRYGAVALGREVAPAAAEAPVTEGDTVASWLREKGYLLTLLLVFLGGLAASLTPCAYPAYFLIFGFLSMGGSRTRSQSLLLSLLTVAGIVVMYVSMGIAAALGGGAVGRIMGNPWVMGAIAGLFLLMALMSLRILPFGDFSRFKSFLATRQKANYLWAFIFGLVLGVIVAPCVGPVVLGILAYVAQGQDLLRGALLMTSFGLGMGVLFLGLGLSSHLMTRRPQVGALGEAMTTAFGVLFVTAALYYLKGVVPWERVFPWLAGIAG
ncbi:MAG: thioredoxin family protein, partial [Deltaproteobacteria bacterium]|nr:thioredoxin family protein [Deltaproteobacteria bacterium]